MQLVLETIRRLRVTHPTHNSSVHAAASIHTAAAYVSSTFTSPSKTRCLSFVCLSAVLQVFGASKAYMHIPIVTGASALVAGLLVRAARATQQMPGSSKPATPAVRMGLVRQHSSW